MNAIYLGDIYSKDELVSIVAKLTGCIAYIKLMIKAWEEDLCPDCLSPIKTENYVNKCSKSPNEHQLGDTVFYLKNIKKRLEEDGLQ